MHVCAHDEERFELDIRSFEVLATYDWPGNVRELKHVIELALLLSGDHAIGAHVIADALGEVTGCGDHTRAEKVQDDFARARILTALGGCGWKTDMAAVELGMHRSHLYREMHRLGILPPRKLRCSSGTAHGQNIDRHSFGSPVRVADREAHLTPYRAEFVENSRKPGENAKTTGADTPRHLQA
jgi:hypothetical protein